MGEEMMWPIKDFDGNDDDDLASALVVVVALDDEGAREGMDALLSPPRANVAAAEAIKRRRENARRGRRGRRKR